jgi:hypothetical protein
MRSRNRNGQKRMLSSLRGIAIRHSAEQSRLAGGVNQGVGLPPGYFSAGCY